MLIGVKQVLLQQSAEWDRYVEKHPQATPYHLMAWGKSVQQAYGHEAVFWAAYQDGDIVGVLPVVNMKIPLLGSRPCSLPFCDLGGVLSDSDDARDALIEHAGHWLKQVSGKSVALRATEDVVAEMPADGSKVRMLLPLAPAVDEQFERFKSKLRSQVRKAGKNGVIFRVANTEDCRGAFYRVMQVNMHQLGSPVHSRQWFDAVLHNYGDKAALGVVEFEGDVVGGAIILFCGETVTVPWASTSPHFNHLSPNMLLYWGLLSTAIERGYARFDFGRSTVGEGTFKFKSQWGAMPVPLSWGALHRDGSIKNDDGGGHGGLRDKIAETWRRLPAPVVNFIGPQLRRYISL